MSLGFRKYAALGVEMREHDLGRESRTVLRLIIQIILTVIEIKYETIPGYYLIYLVLKSKLVNTTFSKMGVELLGLCLSLTPETYYTIADAGSDALPMWLLNDKVVNSEWQRLPVKVVHPLEVPPALRGFAMVLEKTGPAKDPIPGALHAGIFLTLKQLKALHAEFLFSLPPKGAGAGKRGNLVKRDYAMSILTFFFGESLSKEEMSRMMTCMMGQACGKGTGHAKEILTAFKSLPAEDQPHYQDLANIAEDEEKLKQARSERLDAKTFHSSPAHETPRCLAKLLPYGPGFHCRFNRNPLERRYQCYVFDSSSGALSPVLGPVTGFTPTLYSSNGPPNPYSVPLRLISSDYKVTEFLN